MVVMGLKMAKNIPWTCGKFLWENSCGKFLWEKILVGKYLWEILVGSCGKFFGKILWENLAGNSCGKCCRKIFIPEANS